MAEECPGCGHEIGRHYLDLRGEWEPHMDGSCFSVEADEATWNEVKTYAPK